MSRRTTTAPPTAGPKHGQSNVDVGQMIKCGSCKKNLFRVRYSKVAICKYQAALLQASNSGKSPTLPNCRACTIGNTFELECSACHLVKSLDSFSKQQRSNPDAAKCVTCVQEMLDREPDLEVAIEEEKIREEEENRELGPFSGMSNVGSALPSLGGPRLNSVDSAATVSFDGRVRAGEMAPPWAGPDDPADTRSEISSAVSSRLAGTYMTHSDTHSHGSLSPTSTSMSTSRTGFAKQNAYRAPTEERVKTQMQRAKLEKQQVQSARKPVDLSDDDDDWEL